MLFVLSYNNLGVLDLFIQVAVAYSFIFELVFLNKRPPFIHLFMSLFDHSFFNLPIFVRSFFSVIRTIGPGVTTLCRKESGPGPGRITLTPPPITQTGTLVNLTKAPLLGTKIAFSWVIKSAFSTVGTTILAVTGDILFSTSSANSNNMLRWIHTWSS